MTKQGSLFGEAEDRLQAPVQSFAPNPDRVRRRLLALLQVVRAADAMPWPEKEARMWQTVFPQMAKWLPCEEAERLCLAFAQEIERLKEASQRPAGEGAGAPR